MSNKFFFAENQICDWPSRVKRLRPECRGEGEPVIVHHLTRIEPQGPAKPFQHFTPIKTEENVFSSQKQFQHFPPIKTVENVFSSQNNFKTETSSFVERLPAKTVSTKFDLKGLTSFLSDIKPMSHNDLHNFSHGVTDSVALKNDSENLPLSLSSDATREIATTTPNSLDDYTSSTAFNEVPTKSWRKTIENDETKKRKIVLPIANGQFRLDTLNVYTAKNKTNLKPEKYSRLSNSNFIKVNVLKN